MDETDGGTAGNRELAERFEAHRGQLRAVARRTLGSAHEAEDAVQEAWLRLERTGLSGVENLESWLRTVVARLCLDMLRSRRSRREEPLEGQAETARARGRGPDEEAELVDSVGRAMLVVLDTLGPAERVAFVLHDVFAVPFGEIAPVVGRSQVATKKLASRARLRVRGGTPLPVAELAELAEQRRVVEAFLAAARGGDLAALLAVLAPDVVRRSDALALAPGREPVVRGADTVVREVRAFGRNARFAEVALVDGAVGLVVAPQGKLRAALTFVLADGLVAEYELIADPERLRLLDLALVPDSTVAP